MKKKIFLSLGIMSIAGAAFGFYLFNKPHQSIADVKPDFQLDSKSIIGEFENNENAANKKFNGKVIEISGVVSEKSKDEKGKLNVTLEGEDLAGIGCVFDPLSMSKAGNLAEGQKVKIKGVCTGILMDVVMVDCVVVDANQ